MRLTKDQVRTIKEQVAQFFGADAEVSLFGSRVDDAARGGDIDLYIETHAPPEVAYEQSQRLYASLQRKLGEQRIDIVIHSENTPLQPIHEEARSTGITL